MKFPKHTKENTTDQRLMLALFKVENPDFRIEALKRLNDGVDSRRERYVKEMLEEQENRTTTNARIQKEVKEIITQNLDILINGKIAKPDEKKFKGQDGKKVSAWDLVLLMCHGEQFLLNFGDPKVDMRATRRLILSRLPNWNFPAIGLLLNAKEVGKRYDYGRPEEIWEHYRITFEVKY